MLLNSMPGCQDNFFFRPDKHKLTHINIIETHTTHTHKLNITYSYTHTNYT